MKYAGWLKPVFGGGGTELAEVVGVVGGVVGVVVGVVAGVVGVVVGVVGGLLDEPEPDPAGPSRLTSSA
jgi:hypothetical protein